MEQQRSDAARAAGFEVAPETLAFWDIDMTCTMEPGNSSVFAGPSLATLNNTKFKVVT